MTLETEYDDLDVETQLAIAADNEAPVESPDDTRVTNSSETEHKIDARGLKNRVSFSKLLERDGKELIPTDHAFRCMCPFHKDSQDKFYIWSNDSGGTCFGCEWKGDIYAYLMEKHKLEFRELRHLGFELRNPPQQGVHVRLGSLCDCLFGFGCQLFQWNARDTETLAVNPPFLSPHKRNENKTQGCFKCLGVNTLRVSLGKKGRCHNLRSEGL